MRTKSVGGAIGAVLAALAMAPAAHAQLPAVTVHATTTTLPGTAAHTGSTVSAACPGGTRLVGGGSYLSRIDPATLPTNGLVLGGSTASTGASPVDLAGTTADLAHWMGIANFTGVAEPGDQAETFALCATSDGPSGTIVATASTTGANATQEVNKPTLTTASCPAGTRLIGGGATTSTPDQNNDGTTAGNNGNLKPLGSYPSDVAGAPAANGSTSATSWTAFGSAGVPAASDVVDVYALCSSDAATQPVRVARVDAVGQDAQVGTTTLYSAASCPAGTRLLGGGYDVVESVSGVDGLQPQQGYHMRGSYPTTDGSAPVADGATTAGTWTSLVQAGGQNLAAGKHMTNSSFAMCAIAPATPPDLALTASFTPDPAVVGQPLTFTYTIADHGGDATGVSFVQAVPDNMTFVSADPAASCTYAKPQLSCTLGALAAGATDTVKVTVTPTAAGSAMSGSSVTSSPTDPNTADNDQKTTVTIVSGPRAVPTISATAAGSGRAFEPMTASATIGGGSAPTGFVTFKVFGPDDTTCANALAISAEPVTGDGTYTSDPFIPGTGGTYRWTVTYGGDDANEPVTTACGTTDQDVKAVPVIDVDLGVTGATATISDGVAIGGTLTFTVYSDAACTTAISSTVVGVAGDGAYSAGYTLPGPGNYPVTVSYSGDDRNAPVPADCAGSAAVTITQAGGPPVPAPGGGTVPTPTPTPSNHFGAATAKVDHSGAISLSLTAPGAGRFSVTAKSGSTTYGRATATKHAKGKLTLKLKPTAAGKRALERHSKLKLSVSITFTPTGGKPYTRKLTVTIKRG